VNDALEPGRWRRGFRGRRAGAGSGPGAGAAVAGAASGAASLVARLIWLIAVLVALVIAAGIVLVVLKANPGNSVVSTVHDAAKFLVGPFDGIFKPHDHRLAIAINWGIAALVYLAVARLIVRLLGR
jgi:predicted cobalt transporter CbtA